MQDTAVVPHGEHVLSPLELENKLILQQVVKQFCE